MGSINAGWTDCRPEDDIESFTERSAERRQLFQDVAKLGLSISLSPAIWAFLQVADLQNVKKIARDRNLWKTISDSNFGWIFWATDTIRLWKQGPPVPNASKRSYTEFASNQGSTSPHRSQAATPTDSGRNRFKSGLGGREYSPARDRHVADSCKERDNHLCVVSRLAQVDAAHIYPWCAFGGISQVRVKCFWDTLEMFWPLEKVEAWRSKIFQDPRRPDRGTETIENMISLTATLHRFHSAGAFALRPIRMSDDKTQLELEFHWLVRSDRESTSKVDLFDVPPSSKDLESSGIGYGPLLHSDSAGARLLSSGTRFMMTTDDVVNKPLPDPGLLELQWHLQRILAMSGGAGWREMEDDGDDEDDGTGVAVRDTVEWWSEETHSYPAVEDQRRGRSPPTSESDDSVNGA